MPASFGKSVLTPRTQAVTGRSLAGQKLGDAFPHLSVYDDLTIGTEITTDVDLVMSALPTAASA